MELASFDGDTTIPMVTGDRIVIQKAAVSAKILKLNHLSFVEVLTTENAATVSVMEVNVVKSSKT